MKTIKINKKLKNKKYKGRILLLLTLCATFKYLTSEWHIQIWDLEKYSGGNMKHAW